MYFGEPPERRGRRLRVKETLQKWVVGPGHGITIERVITDNAKNYRISRDFAAAATAIGAQQKFIRPHCPWTNGKVERFNRTLGAEWAYSRTFVSNDDRAALLPNWLDHYNLNRPHLGIGGRSPIDRVNNAAGQYT
jgi:transposase InsO family protein